ncbi:hypothetical protein CASFOL_010968 [Castilleja foliolosa]|uniref:Uncharacterized protein n=1 Tax=Castilleja foliolosa TaxID=1961234 RepID=A0ABD3DU36_9LAMI
MDSPDISEEEQENLKNNEISFNRSVFLSVFAVVSSLSIFMVLLFSVLYVAVLIGNLSIWSPISVHSRCRIVSTSVDLRSSKVCELGLLNYKAKHVFYPYERKKYRCHYDYYWASVFKVEYIDHSGQARLALAETPNEALPYNCRPNFGAAWLTKDKFKVNGTYECWYTLGIAKVNINHKGLFDCPAEYPSTFEMIKRYYILVYKDIKVHDFESRINKSLEMGCNSRSYNWLYHSHRIHYLDWVFATICVIYSSTRCISDVWSISKYGFTKAVLFLCSVFLVYELGHYSIRKKDWPLVDTLVLYAFTHSIFR